MRSVTRFPINSTTRRRNRLGKLAVPCQVTDRWLQLGATSTIVAGAEFISLDVMTDSSDARRKICSLIITRADLENALSKVRLRRSED
jgi:hypothetical protein